MLLLLMVIGPLSLSSFLTEQKTVFPLDVHCPYGQSLGAANSRDPSMVVKGFKYADQWTFLKHNKS